MTHAVGRAAHDPPPSPALLVIAHPDDEAMFFGPLLISTRLEMSWHILCLSTGARCDLLLLACHLDCPQKFEAEDCELSWSQHHTADWTAGNAEGLGAVRRREIEASAQILGVSTLIQVSTPLSITVPTPGSKLSFGCLCTSGGKHTLSEQLRIVR
jgi:LmbE family N-acetylglucosaminyl deacetylase